MTGVAFERFRSALDAGGFKIKTEGPSSFSAQCSGHNGDDLNMRVTDSDGKFLVKCHSHGCTAESIMAGVGLTMRDMFDKDGRAEYDYGNGHRAFRQDIGGGKKKFWQKDVPEFRQLRVVPGARPIADSATVFVAEGEQAADALWRLAGESCVVTWSGGAANLGKTDWKPLSGKAVVFVPDADEAGQKTIIELDKILEPLGARMSVWVVPETVNGHELGPKRDAADVLLAGGSLDDLTVAEKGGWAVPGGYGRLLGEALDETVEWLSRFIVVAEPQDINLLALWAAHTHLGEKIWLTPRLIIDSAMPGSGKTTVLEHLMRLAFHPVQAASINSSALLARLIRDEPRTLLVDEVDRSLDPKNPMTGELLSVINSGYKRGGTRPVLMPGKGGDWVPEEMSTFAPVAMAGNAPNLPDDTRSRSLRIVMLPDFNGDAEDSDWEEIEQAAVDLGIKLAEAVREAADEIVPARPPLPEGLRGRAKERWAVMSRIGFTAGTRWGEIVTDLIERDLAEVEAEREAGLILEKPAVVLLKHLNEVWPEGQARMTSADLIDLLVQHAPEQWSEISHFGTRLTAQRLGRMLSQAYKIHAKKSGNWRGYVLSSFQVAFGRFGLPLSYEPPPTARNRPTALSGVAS